MTHEEFPASPEQLVNTNIEAIVRQETRFIIENAATNKLLDLLNNSDRAKFEPRRDTRAPGIGVWLNRLLTKPEVFKQLVESNRWTTPYNPGKEGTVSLYWTLSWIVNQLKEQDINISNSTTNVPKDLNMGVLKPHWQRLLTEVAKQQGHDLGNLLKALYERDFSLINNNRLNNLIVRIGAPYFRTKDENWLTNLIKQLNVHIVALWGGVQRNDEKVQEEQVRALLKLIGNDSFAYNHQNGLGLLAEGIIEAFREIGVRVTLGSREFEFNIENINWDWLRRHAQGKGLAHDPTERTYYGQHKPTILNPGFFYSWWLLKDVETYRRVAAGKRFPQPDEGQELKLGITVRHQHFENAIARPPNLPPRGVYACGSAALHIKDFVLRGGWEAFWHGIVREPKMGLLEKLGAWYQAGQLTMDKNLLEWHWHIWTLGGDGNDEKLKDAKKELRGDIEGLEHENEQHGTHTLRWYMPREKEDFENVLRVLKQLLENDGFESIREDEKLLEQIKTAHDKVRKVIAEWEDKGRNHPATASYSNEEIIDELKEINDALKKERAA